MLPKDDGTSLGFPAVDTERPHSPNDLGGSGTSFGSVNRKRDSAS